MAALNKGGQNDQQQSRLFRPAIDFDLGQRLLARAGLSRERTGPEGGERRCCWIAAHLIMMFC